MDNKHTGLGHEESFNKRCLHLKSVEVSLLQELFSSLKQALDDELFHLWTPLLIHLEQTELDIWLIRHLIEVCPKRAGAAKG